MLKTFPKKETRRVEFFLNNVSQQYSVRIIIVDEEGKEHDIFVDAKSDYDPSFNDYLKMLTTNDCIIEHKRPYTIWKFSAEKVNF